MFCINMYSEDMHTKIHQGPVVSKAFSLNSG